MASVTDQELIQMSQEERVTAFGMRTEQLTGHKTVANVTIYESLLPRHKAQSS